ncbi:MAG TPA: HAD family hydrolase [Candidatus Dormibacteraeota bacterium]
MPAPLRAVTFDFWQTLFVPGGGFGARLAALNSLVRARRPELPEGAAEAVLKAAAEENGRQWRAGLQFGATGLLGHVVEKLGLNLDPGERERFLELIEDPPTERELPPVPGAPEAVHRLRERGLRLGIVSDTGFRPGRVLRRQLAAVGILECFEPAALAFSDEVGVPKPHPRIFEAALRGLEVEPGEAVHVGDLKFTDVAGARGVGMRVLRFTGFADDAEEGPEADAVVSSYADLEGALDRL